MELYQVTDLHQELHLATAECELQFYQELHLECTAIKNYTLLVRERVEGAAVRTPVLSRTTP